MTLRALLAQMEAGDAAALHVSVLVRGGRQVCALRWQGGVRGQAGEVTVGIVQPPAYLGELAEALVLRLPDGRFVPCTAAEAARKGLVLDARGQAAAGAAQAWLAAVDADRRAGGVRTWHPR